MSTTYFYNHTIPLLVAASVAATDTLKVMLLGSSATFNATHTTIAEVSSSGAYEVSGNGWATGGEVISGITFDQVPSTAHVMLDGDDVSRPIVGGSLGPIYHYVVFDDTLTDDPPLILVTLDAPLTISENYQALIQWGANGIIYIEAQ